MAKKRPTERKKSQGTLLIIGGHEDRRGECRILKEIAHRVGKRKLVVTTIASTSAADELWEEYRKCFTALGVTNVVHLRIAHRSQSLEPEQLSIIEGAHGFFFTGGDQLKITSELGGTDLLQAICDLYEQGGVIGGTSAGASVMADAMLISGPSESTFRQGCSLRMAPGLGLMKHAIIDQHFSERGRIGRLLGAVAQNPRTLGIGIDENTAIVVEKNQFRVIGSGGVYVVDAHAITDTNICDATADQALSIFNVSLHVLSHGDVFDLLTRVPFRPLARESAA